MARPLQQFAPLAYEAMLVRSFEVPDAKIRSEPWCTYLVAFDSPAALSAALNSPLREEMRADFRKFPPFSGRVTHFPMLTRSMPGSRDPS